MSMNVQEPFSSGPQPPVGGAGSPDRAETARPASRRAKIWFVVRLIEVRLRFVLLFVAVGLVVGKWEWLQNHWEAWLRPSAAAATLDSGTEFYCPMCPSVRRDSLDPGGAVPKCPICGMPLSKRKKGVPDPLTANVVGRVQLSPQRVALAGIRNAEVAVQPLTKEIRAVGTVVYDESRRARIVSRVSGYVEQLFVNKTFDNVQEGDPLAELYSPELYAAAQELLIAQRSSLPQLADTSREKLRLLGLDDREIDRILSQGAAQYRLAIRAPRAGVVIRKNVLAGDRVEMGQVLFEVADLSSVWIEADVFEREIAALQAGQQVEAEVDAVPGQRFQGRLDAIYPELRAATRTNRVRFVVDNANLLLRPGMYATVRLTTPVQELEPFRTIHIAAKAASLDAQTCIDQQQICPVTGAALGSMGDPVPVQVGDEIVYLCCAGCQSPLESDPAKYLARIRTVTDAGVLAVPDRAVIDTGDQQVVYVEREPGVYEGVLVQLGPAAGGYYAVVSGLRPGDRVAAAGAFLVDAETRLNPAAAAAYFGATGQPDRHAAHQPALPRKRETPSAEALQQLAQLAPDDRSAAMAQRWCPVTELPLGSMGPPVKLVLQGETVFLCCEGCRAGAERDAVRTVEQVRAWRALPATTPAVDPVHHETQREAGP
jgi:Cu(I)/Ag(I) efflux system membrane fusion protein